MKKEETSDPVQKKFRSCRLFLFFYPVLCVLLLTQICFPQVDTTRLKREQQQQMEKMKDAQQKALEQLKQMGIDIDPNKKMTKEEARKLKDKLVGKGKQMQDQMQTQLPQGGKTDYKHSNVDISKIPTQTMVLEIAGRFFNRSYKELDIFRKTQFDKDYKEAEKNKFDLQSVRFLSNKGAELITFGSDHFIACVYLTSAVKAFPGDTLSVNNFGGYLRIIDSVEISLPVLLYANSLFSESPVILTQIGCSLLELNDDVKAEKYLKDALKYNPEFGQARTALCEVYIRQGRFKEALIELFAGVKYMGATYQQASIANARIQNGYGSSGKDDFSSESKNQLKPSDEGQPSGSKTDRIKMPAFPACARVEDWTEGGGFASALESYKSFTQYIQSFTKQFGIIHQQMPAIPENAILRDYPNERFALDCITEMFMDYSKEESKKHHQIIKEITQRVSDAKDRYVKNFTEYTQKYAACLNACPQGDTICPKECYRKYCAQQCPNANQYNEFLRMSFGNYNSAFIGTLNKQIKLLDDLYAFSDPWFEKIYSPYWSRIYAYEIRRVALAIVQNAYVYYPQMIEPPVNDACGSDCSIYSTPITAKPEEVNKNDPDGNNCPSNSKFKIPLAICELGLDCESIEFGCTALASASVKRNFRKKNTTIFLGVGMKGELGVVSAGAKAGAVVTFDDRGEVQDVGGKVDVSVSAGVGAARVGASSSGSYTVMKGFDSKVDFVGGLSKPK